VGFLCAKSTASKELTSIYGSDAKFMAFAYQILQNSEGDFPGFDKSMTLYHSLERSGPAIAERRTGA